MGKRRRFGFSLLHLFEINNEKFVTQPVIALFFVIITPRVAIYGPLRVFAPYIHVRTCVYLQKMHPYLQDYILRWITSHFTSEAIQQCFYGGWSHEWKSFPNRLTTANKIVIHANPYIILFRKRYCMYWTYKFAKTIIDRSSRHCRQGRFFCLSIFTSP